MSKRVSNRLGIWKALVFSVVVCTLVILRLPMDCSTPLAFHPLRLTRIQRTREYEPDVESIAPSNVHLKRVAIIGGGAAGTSFSYFMQKLLPEAVLTLYEASARIGGRAKLANINIPKELIGWTGNVTSIPVEVGASIFVTVNEHLYKLAQEFGLNFTDGDNRNISPSKVPPVGIYDGEKFVYKASTSTWKSIVSAIWRWGFFSTTRSRYLALEASKRFSSAYKLAEIRALGFNTVPGLLKALKLNEWAFSEAMYGLKKEGLGELYLKEFVEAATRVNYGQNLDLNELGALICLVAAFVPAKAIQGGNDLIFKEMLARSMTKIHMSTRVTTITKVETSDGKRVYLVHDNMGHVIEYDSVVLAISNKEAQNIRFVNISPPKTLPFVHLHVTFVTGNLNASYFHQPENFLPAAILTTNSTVPFNSISVRHEFGDPSSTSITKIFSSERMSDEMLERLYSRVLGVERFEWDAYPQLKPISDLPSFEIEAEIGWGGVYHINAMESVVSTMETETVAARNVAQLLVRSYTGRTARQ